MISELRTGLSGTSIANVGKHAEQKGLLSYVHATFIEIRSGNKSIRVSLLHAIYLWDVINNFDYYFHAVEPFVFEETLVVDYSMPRYHKVPSFGEMPIFFSSFAEPLATTNQYLEWANLKEGDVALDLGAYSGLSSILFSNAVGIAGRVICLEPDELNIDAVKKNVSLHESISGRKIDVLEYAAWEHCDGIEFSCEGNMGASATSIVGGRGKVKKVPSITLSEIVSRLSIKKIDFMKIDIEGAEEFVLRSSVDILKQHRPRIVIEPHMVAGGMSTEACEAQLAKAGYHVERIHQNGGVYMSGSSIPLLFAAPD